MNDNAQPTPPAEAKTDPATGLSNAEAQQRLQTYGPNAITEKHISPLRRFLSFLWGPIPWMIEIAAILSAAVQRWEDFSIIAIMLLINAIAGFREEYKADNAIAALKKNLALKAHVLRDSLWQELPARQLVPGDIVMLHLGNIVPADVELLDGDYLSVDQSALTGESLPVDKKTGDTVYSSSIAKAGQMKARVTATGSNTFFGQTAQLVESAGSRSHFQKAVMRIGDVLILITLG
ncbi:MAG: HAD-IC family P-type ATPase, partial [Alcanivorax sp.]|nr:HAD-IC family P-type ATPase [Alcanivorax sp.]